MLGFWIALAVLVVGFVAGLTYAVLRGLALWRRFKRTGQSFGTEAARIAEASDRIQGHLDRAEASRARLGEAGARLSTSRVTLDVQLQALREARHTMRRLLWFVPGV